MLRHPTLDKLQELKLTGMYQALMEQTNIPDIEAMSFEERGWPSECARQAWIVGKGASHELLEIRY